MATANVTLSTSTWTELTACGSAAGDNFVLQNNDPEDRIIYAFASAAPADSSIDGYILGVGKFAARLGVVGKVYARLFPDNPKATAAITVTGV